MKSEWLPISEAPKIDGQKLLALVQHKWQKQPEYRIIAWNDGIGKAGYDWPTWMDATVTLSIEPEAILGWMPLPPVEGNEVLAEGWMMMSPEGEVCNGDFQRDEIDLWGETQLRDGRMGVFEQTIREYKNDAEHEGYRAIPVTIIKQREK